MPAKPGNRNAAYGREFRDALRKAVGGSGPQSKLPKIAKKLVDEALAGEQWAIQELANRLDGKPQQAVQITGDEENPLQSVMRVELVPLDNSKD